jgi:hypothetical protein
VVVLIQFSRTITISVTRWAAINTLTEMNLPIHGLLNHSIRLQRAAFVMATAYLMFAFSWSVAVVVNVPVNADLHPQPWSVQLVVHHQNIILKFWFPFYFEGFIRFVSFKSRS